MNQLLYQHKPGASELLWHVVSEEPAPYQEFIQIKLIY